MKAKVGSAVLSGYSRVGRVNGPPHIRRRPVDPGRDGEVSFAGVRWRQVGLEKSAGVAVAPGETDIHSHVNGQQGP